MPASPSASVFINCPFDSRYQPLFEAIVFCVSACGFVPRCTLELTDAAEVRIENIYRLIDECHQGIHDISRTEVQGQPYGLPRFNMPLELGMAMARRFMEPANEHDWLVLVPSGHTYARFVSDLTAYDPVTHDGSVPSVVVAVMSWLATRTDAVPPVTPKEVLALLPSFQMGREALDDAWGGFPPWADIIMAALDIARQLG